MTTPTGYAEMFQWADGNPNNEDRVGCTVTLYDGDKIKIAGHTDEVIGVVGGDNTSVGVIGNASQDEWHGKHLRDAANRLMWEKQVMVEWIDNGYRHFYEADRLPEGLAVPSNATYYHDVWNGHKLLREILSEEYKNPGKPIEPYLPRWERKEWGIVVLLGRVVVKVGNNGSKCDPRWKRLRADNGTGFEEWLIR